MILGIDATNIRSGGGLTHLKEILFAVDINTLPFKKLIVWSNQETLNELPNAEWLIKKTHRWLNKSNVFSFFYQILLLSKSARRSNCSLVFVPGGSFLGSFKNIVSMSRNMLPFEKEERNRFGIRLRLKFTLLKYIQSYTFKKSLGVIFLTNYAKDYVAKIVNLKNEVKIIPHGINLRFLSEPKKQLDIHQYTSADPYKLLYVSIVDAYKHQWNVAGAVLKLKDNGYPIRLDLVGGPTSFITKLEKVMANDYYNVINYKGLIPYSELDDIYKKADAFVFASSCENMPNILIEAMSAGLPIASSNKGPMPEVLGEGGFYFNPTNADSIYNVIKQMLESKEHRTEKSFISYKKTLNYTWEDCSSKTFDFLLRIAEKH